MKRKLPNTLPRISPIPAGDDTAELIHTLERFAREANDQRSDQTGEVRPAYDGREVRAPVLGRGAGPAMKKIVGIARGSASAIVARRFAAVGAVALKKPFMRSL